MKEQQDSHCILCALWKNQRKDEYQNMVWKRWFPTNSRGMRIAISCTVFFAAFSTMRVEAGQAARAARLRHRLLRLHIFVS